METGNVKMLARAPRLGARFGVTIEGATLYVSTVLYGQKKYTRVEADECETVHFSGVLGEYEAARAYMDGAEIASKPPNPSRPGGQP